MDTKQILTKIGLMFIGGLFGFLGSSLISKDAQENTSLETKDLTEQNLAYRFISPLLECGDYTPANSTAKISNEIESKVGKYVASQKSKGLIKDASVYFRALNGGAWALINPDLKSIPGSLLKVPLAISVYEHAEKNPGFLDAKVVFDKNEDGNFKQFYEPKQKAYPNTDYTVRQLVDLLLKYSDNNAAYALTGILSDKELSASYSRLGIEIPTTQEEKYAMPVRTYASFFRILYNSSYLSKDSSEELLDTLSESDFADGIVGGVPKEILVSHKFGERISVDSSGSDLEQLHDCGIVYEPNSPYIVCVMTQGKKFEDLAKTISDISKIVYDVVKD